MATKEQVQLALALAEGRQKPEPGQAVVIANSYPCDLCGAPGAIVDGKITVGPWAYMCSICFSESGVGIGPGLGQVLIWREKGE